MFTWLNKQGVKSNEGFIVQRTGRFTCEYQEGGLSLEVEVESGLIGEKPCISIRREAFSAWQGPLIGGETKADQQSRLLRNFQAAMEFQGLGLVLY